MTPDEPAEFDAAEAEIRALIRELDAADALQRREIAAAAKGVIARLPRRDQRPLTTEFLKAYTKAESGETPAATEQLCARCGWPVIPPQRGAKYAICARCARADRADNL